MPCLRARSDRLGLRLDRADVLAVNKDGKVLQARLEFHQIGELDLDRHVERGESEVVVAAALVVLHLPKLNRE